MRDIAYRKAAFDLYVEEIFDAACRVAARFGTGGQTCGTGNDPGRPARLGA